MRNRNFSFVAILALSAFIITATMSSASGNSTLDAFAQSNSSSNSLVGNTTTSGNITGGGVNVPLNESSSAAVITVGNQSLVPAANESQDLTQTALKSETTNQTFSINTDMMRPVLYLIDPKSDRIITVDLSKNPKYPNGSMPLHTMITPGGNAAFLSTMSSDTAPATILALKIGNIDWDAGNADVSITNVINISEPGTMPKIPDIRNHTTNDTQPIIKKMWFPNNVQIHGPTLHPGERYAYFTQWTDNMIRVLDVNNGSLAPIDPIQFGNATEWLHGVFFNPSGNKALSPHYFFEGNHLHLFDVNNETGELSNPLEISLGNKTSYAAFPHFVTWINNTHAITSTQQLGPTSATPNNTKVIGPSVWLIDTEIVKQNNSSSKGGNLSQSTTTPAAAAATMIIPFTNSTQGNGIFKPASDTTIVGTKLYVAEEDSMDKNIDNLGQVSVWDITNLQSPQLIKRLSPGQGLPENFQLGHTIYATPDGKLVYVEDWNSGQLVKIDTSTDKAIKVFDKKSSGFIMPHGGFITGQYR